MITLDDAANFFERAHERCPESGWTVDLDPGQLSPSWPHQWSGRAGGDGPSLRPQRRTGGPYCAPRGQQRAVSLGINA